MRRFLVALFAIFCLLYQIEWPAWAALSLPDAATMNCPCRGTEQCCCRMKMKQGVGQTGAHTQCHRESTQKPRQQSAQCVIEADDCGHSSPAEAKGVSREPALLARATLIHFISAQLFHAESPVPLQVVSTEPPFIPPRASSV